jgi:hypothetical protein
MTTIQIDVQGGKVTCGTNGGHIRAPHGTAITWTSSGEDKMFELEFEQLGVETAGAAHPLVHWPFEKPAAPMDGPRNDFTGILKNLPSAAGHAPVYKYNVRVGKLLLDPIIIVDR